MHPRRAVHPRTLGGQCTLGEADSAVGCIQYSTAVAPLVYNSCLVEMLKAAAAVAAAMPLYVHIDIRASIESASITEPQNSITWPVPPAVPITPQMCSTTSFEVHDGSSLPLT